MIGYNGPGLTIAIGPTASEATRKAATALALIAGETGLTDMNRRKPVLRQATPESLNGNISPETVVLYIGEHP